MIGSIFIGVLIVSNGSRPFLRRNRSTDSYAARHFKFGIAVEEVVDKAGGEFNAAATRAVDGGGRAMMAWTARGVVQTS